MRKKRKKKITIEIILAILLVVGTYITIATNFLGILKPSRVDRSTTNIVSTEDQSGGIAANVINLGQQQRHITDEIKNRLDNDLNPYKGWEITMAYVAGDIESYNFALGIQQYLKSKNWTVGDDFGSFWAPLPTGWKIMPSGDNELDLFIGIKQP